MRYLHHLGDHTPGRATLAHPSTADHPPTTAIRDFCPINSHLPVGPRPITGPRASSHPISGRLAFGAVRGYPIGSRHTADRDLTAKREHGGWDPAPRAEHRLL